jgi:FAD/FMN-containing dehydrogenase
LILCEKLGADKVIFPGNGHDTHRKSGEQDPSSYMFAQAAEITPACSIFPADTQDVVLTINILREAGATFAVKSGGHSTYSTGSNVENGIVIDLCQLKNINISEDRKSVTVGSGCRFGEVYSKLENLNLGCIGGRVSSVGVGGLVLGGMVYYPRP